jgi:hypothetical protein
MLIIPGLPEDNGSENKELTVEFFRKKALTNNQPFIEVR